MTEIFRDRHKVALMMATLFFLGVAASFYQIYSLPHNLMLTDASHPALFKVYLVLGLTFLIGGFTLWSALNYRKEVIVYRDKQMEQSENGNADQQGSVHTISLDSVKEHIQQATNDKEILQQGLNAICKQLDAGQGALYTVTNRDGAKKVELISGFALAVSESHIVSYDLGEGLIGQAAVSGKTVYLDDIPQGYIKIVSGLGSASPRFLLIVPIQKDNHVSGVIEIATFTTLDEHQRKFAEDAAKEIADKLNNQEN
jgi:hypothetical protein